MQGREKLLVPVYSFQERGWTRLQKEFEDHSSPNCCFSSGHKRFNHISSSFYFWSLNTTPSKGIKLHSSSASFPRIILRGILQNADGTVLEDLLDRPFLLFKSQAYFPSSSCSVSVKQRCNSSYFGQSVVYHNTRANPVLIPLFLTEFI